MRAPGRASLASTTSRPQYNSLPTETQTLRGRVPCQDLPKGSKLAHLSRLSMASSCIHYQIAFYSEQCSPPCPSRPPPVRRERVKPSSRAKRPNPLPRSDYYSPFPPPTFFSKAEIGVSPETSGDKANRIQQDAGKKTPLQVLMQVVRCPDVVIEKLRNPPKLYRAVF